jgi:O-antigen biosynthesis protein
MTHTLRSSFGLIGNRTVAGFVYDAAQPDRQFVVEILVDGIPAGSVRADAFSPALAAEGSVDPQHGFVLTLGQARVETGRTIEARIANLDTPVAMPIDLDTRPRHDLLLAAPGAIEKAEGSEISGWVAAAAGTNVVICASVGGEEVAATIARDWNARPIGGESRPVLQFTLKLPPSLSHEPNLAIHVATLAGVALSGSPAVIAAAGGVKSACD